MAVHNKRARTGVTRRRAIIGGAGGVAALTVAGVAMADSTGRNGASGTAPSSAGVPPLDSVKFGDPASEKAHSLNATLSSTVIGGMKQTARIFHPTAPTGVWGGKAAFRLRCDPKAATYVTVKLWGSDKGYNKGMLMLFCDGEQVGHHQLGAVDPVDIASDSMRKPGCFYYHTLPLPTSMTKGRSEVQLEIRSMGHIWRYGISTDDYYRKLEQPTRGVYRVYTHTDPFFTPPKDDVQGNVPLASAARKTPGEADMLTRIHNRVTGDINRLLAGSGKGLPLWNVLFLAEAYAMPSTSAYNNGKALDRIVEALDSLYTAYLANAQSTLNNPADQKWGGHGIVGHILFLVAGALGNRLTPSRRYAYTRLLVDSRDYWRQHLPGYTMQAMICAHGIYWANRGLTAIAPGKALPESKARTYLHQAAGVSPWLGPESADGTPTRPLGSNYHSITAKGLSRELGYVGHYGEVLDWVTLLYEAVTSHGGPADEALRSQIVKIAQARASFRFPSPDDDGYRAMRMQAIVGWRDTDYPGVVAYGQPSTTTGHPLMAAIATGSPILAGHAQQLIADGQLWNQLDMFAGYDAPDVGATALRFLRDYEAFNKLGKSGARLPMTAGQKDYVFSDEENGVVALKHGDEILYASLYWRALYGINGLARVHHITPRFDRSGTVRLQIVFPDSGLRYTEPDWTNYGFANGGYAAPGPVLHQAFAGEKLPIAKAPVGVPQPQPGVENPYAGRGTFYSLRYGPYLIGMNAGSTAHWLTTPASGTARNIATGASVSLNGRLQVGPRSTVVLHLP
ncbi:MAG: hypothetical protein JO362_12860 [Streptomycetaceae bacterium]|nr:hypothetical protein [Streptomycetaceae bacterium]